MHHHLIEHKGRISKMRGHYSWFRESQMNPSRRRNANSFQFWWMNSCFERSAPKCQKYIAQSYWRSLKIATRQSGSFFSSNRLRNFGLPCSGDHWNWSCFGENLWHLGSSKPLQQCLLDLSKEMHFSKLLSILPQKLRYIFIFEQWWLWRWWWRQFVPTKKTKEIREVL